MTRLALAAVFLTLCAVGGVTAARALGAQQPPVPGLEVLTMPHCPAPCWHGITPGQTSPAHASDILRAEAQVTALEAVGKDLCWNMQSQTGQTGWRGCLSEVRRLIRFEPPANTLRLGDLMALWGAPNATAYCVEMWYSNGQLTRRSRATLQFGHMRVLAGQSLQRNGSRIDPNMVVSYIEFRPESRFFGLPWQGFSKRSERAECR